MAWGDVAKEVLQQAHETYKLSLRLQTEFQQQSERLAALLERDRALQLDTASRLRAAEERIEKLETLVGALLQTIAGSSDVPVTALQRREAAQLVDEWTKSIIAKTPQGEQAGEER